LFVPVLNALLLLFVGELVKGFEVAGFWPALGGSLVISFVSIVINVLLGRGPRMEVRSGSRRPPGGPSGPGTGNGPVIDV
jgi:putative membrane protein